MASSEDDNDYPLRVCRRSLSGGVCLGSCKDLASQPAVSGFSGDSSNLVARVLGEQ